MIKYLTYLLLALTFSVISCQKEEIHQSVVKQDVTFGIDLVNNENLKNDSFDYKCPSDEDDNLYEPAVAQIEIKDANNVTDTYYPEVFYLNGKLYTQAIKLESGSYSIIKFLLWNEHPVTGTNPKIIMATPEKGADFADYVSEGVDIDLNVNAFTKTEIQIDVLCFVPQYYNSFGFTWYEITELIIREFCFFGDICANGDGGGNGGGNGGNGGGSQEETAWSGNFEGEGAAWWYYFDTDGPATQSIYAGQQITDGTVTYQNGTITIDLGSWTLQNDSESVKIQGYNDGNLPTSRPAPGNFSTYKGDQLTITVTPFRYYAIHLDVEGDGSKLKNDAPYSTDDFIGSAYDDVPGGIQIDMPAIFEVHVFRNGVEVPNSPFSNLGNEDQPLCVQYPDRIRVANEEFTFKLYIFVPDGTGGFHYKHYHTFTSTDDGPLDVDDLESDGVIDFVLGNCNYSPTDLQLSWIL